MISHFKPSLRICQPCLKSEDQLEFFWGSPFWFPILGHRWPPLATRTRWAVGRVELSGVDELTVSLLQAVRESEILIIGEWRSLSPIYFDVNHGYNIYIYISYIYIYIKKIYDIYLYISYIYIWYIYIYYIIIYMIYKNIYIIYQNI